MTNKLVQGVPAVPYAAMVDDRGIPTLIWYTFFVNLWNRTGGAAANLSPLLDNLASSVGSILYRGVTAWTGLNIGADYQVLRAFNSTLAWVFLDGKSFGSQLQNALFIAPVGGAGDPTFRVLATADLDSVAGAIPGIGDGSAAVAGNVGETISQSVAPGSAIVLTNATIADVTSVPLTPGDWDVWANIGIAPGAGATMTSISAWINIGSAVDPGAPNGGAYVTSVPPAAFAAQQVLPVGSMTIETATNITAYLSTNVAFSGGTAGAFGAITARRRR